MVGSETLANRSEDGSASSAKRGRFIEGEQGVLMKDDATRNSPVRHICSGLHNAHKPRVFFYTFFI